MDFIELRDIGAAQRRLDDEALIRKAPIESSRSLSAMMGAGVHSKMEHLQRTSTFKTRGGGVQQALTGRQRRRASGGGQRDPWAWLPALAATEPGLESTIVMPTDAPQTKIDATRGYGATVEL